MYSVRVAHMHGVGRGVERGDVALQDIKMKRRSEQPPPAKPLLPVTYQQTLSWDVRETQWGGEGDCYRTVVTVDWTLRRTKVS